MAAAAAAHGVGKVDLALVICSLQTLCADLTARGVRGYTLKVTAGVAPLYQ